MERTKGRKKKREFASVFFLGSYWIESGCWIICKQLPGRWITNTCNQSLTVYSIKFAMKHGLRKPAIQCIDRVKWKNAAPVRILRVRVFGFLGCFTPRRKGRAEIAKSSFLGEHGKIFAPWRGQNQARYFATIGRRRPIPKALLLTRKTGAVWWRLNSLILTRRRMRATSFSS